MLFRLLMRSLRVRKSSSLTALVTVVAACAVGTAILNLSLDARAKLQNEFRSFGANAVALPGDGISISEESIAALQAELSNGSLAAPIAFAVANTLDGRPVVVAGVDFETMRRMNPWWSVTAWPAAASDKTISALLGQRAASSLGSSGLELRFADSKRTISTAGILTTGGPEDSRIYMDRHALTEWTRSPVSMVEISIAGDHEAIAADIARLNIIAGVSVRPLRQITEGEASVLGKAQSAFSTTVILIIAISFLCVLATLSASVMERRKDFAVMKALGASQAMVRTIFAAEAALLGIGGAVLGYTLGVLIAIWIGHANLNISVAPRLQVFPLVLLASLTICLLSALFPMRILNAVQPSVMLKGD
jgi:putative ABC transport system permease protein